MNRQEDKINKIMIMGSIIIAIFVLGCVDIFTEAETTFQIGKFDISKSNTSTYEYEINYNTMNVNITVVNITPEELSKIPVLEKEIIDCADKMGYYSICKVSKDDWHKIKNFIDNKRENTSYPSCFKFGEKYGETCYMFNFIRP